MSFGAGGGGPLPNHEHTNIALDGGPLDFVNTTIASLSAGSVTYSSGAALQELTIGNAGETLTVNGGGTAPEWAAGSAGAWSVEGNDINTSLGTELAVTVSDADVYQVIWNVAAGNGVSTCCMRINDVSTSSYDGIQIVSNAGLGYGEVITNTKTKFLMNGGGSDPSHNGMAYIYKSDSNFASGNQGGVTMISETNRYTTSPVNLSIASGTNDTITGAITKISLLCMHESSETNEQIIGSMRVNSLSYS